MRAAPCLLAAAALDVWPGLTPAAWVAAVRRLQYRPDGYPPESPLTGECAAVGSELDLLPEREPCRGALPSKKTPMGNAAWMDSAALATDGDAAPDFDALCGAPACINEIRTLIDRFGRAGCWQQAADAPGVAGVDEALTPAEQAETMAAVVPVAIDGMITGMCSRNEYNQYCGAALLNAARVEPAPSGGRGPEGLGGPGGMGSGGLGGPSMGLQEMCGPLGTTGCCVGTIMDVVDRVLASIPDGPRKKLRMAGRDPEQGVRFFEALIQSTCKDLRWEPCIPYSPPALLGASSGGSLLFPVLLVFLVAVCVVLYKRRQERGGYMPQKDFSEQSSARGAYVAAQV